MDCRVKFAPGRPKAGPGCPAMTAETLRAYRTSLSLPLSACERGWLARMAELAGPSRACVQMLRLLCRAVSPNGGYLARTGADRDEETIKFRYKERGSGAWTRRQAREAFVWSRRVDDVDRTRAATNIKSFALRVCKHVVGVSADAQLIGLPAALDGESAELWRVSENDKNL
jgi:hypothetical protein